MRLKPESNLTLNCKLFYFHKTKIHIIIIIYNIKFNDQDNRFENEKCWKSHPSMIHSWFYYIIEQEKNSITTYLQ